MTSILYLCFFLSGMSALIYEIAWSRELVRLLGSSLYAVSTLTSLFLAGLALGAAGGGFVVDGRRGRFTPRAVLQTYAALEAIVAVFGAALPFVFSARNLEILFNLLPIGSNETISYIARFIYACVLLLPPTALMGASFPVLVSFVSKDHERTTENLYAVNTAGAVFGCALATFAIMPALGLSASSFVAVGLNVLCSCTAIVLSTRCGAPRQTQQNEAVLVSADPKSISNAEPAAAFVAHPPATGKKKPASGSEVTFKSICIAAFFTGLAALALEVAWTRLFSLILGSSTFSLGCILGIFLLGLAFGSFFVAKVLRKLNQPLVLAASALGVCATYIVVSLYLFNELPWLYLTIAQGFSKSGRLSFELSILARVIVVSSYIFIPTICMGTVLPLLFQAAKLNETNSSKRVGLLYACNTIGGIIGAMLTGFILIPMLGKVLPSGIQSSIAVAAAVQAVLGLVLFNIFSRSFVPDKETGAIVNGTVIFVAMAVALNVVFVRPEWNKQIMSSGATFYLPPDIQRLDRETFLASLGVSPSGHSLDKRQLLFYREGLNTTVTVGENRKRDIIYLRNDGKTEAALPVDPQAPPLGSDITTHYCLGKLPSDLHVGNIEHALVIGYGTGTTSGAVLRYANPKQLEIAELEPCVLETNHFFDKLNFNPLEPILLSSGKVKPIVNDGRFVLSTSANKYDLIVSQPADPWVSGASDLFTKEFWELAKSRLTENGVVSQWVQLYSIKPQYFGALCRTFQQVFPDSMLMKTSNAGECILVGFNGKHKGIDEVQLPPGAHLSSAQLAAMCQSFERLTHGPAIVNTDDNCVVEYAAARDAMTQEQNIDENQTRVEVYARH